MPRTQQANATPEFDRIVGERLRAARARQKYTQRQLSERIGISYQMLQKHENGRVPLTLHRLIQILDVLDQPLRDFLPIDDFAVPPGYVLVDGLPPPILHALNAFLRAIKRQVRCPAEMNSVDVNCASGTVVKERD